MSHCVSHKECLTHAITTAEMICKEKGVRFSSSRRRVLELIWSSHTPNKAYDILDVLSSEDSAAKPPTVYRALDFLMANGLVHKISSLNAYVGCSHPTHHQGCYFLICTQCHFISECCNDNLAEEVFKTAEKNHFTVKQVTLEIEGLCQECAKHH